jgi:hypothetical protein
MSDFFLNECWSIIIPTKPRLTFSSLISKAQNATTSTPPVEVCVASGTYKLPHNDDCASYYECVNGTSTVLECPIGQLFNVEVSQCEMASNVFCDQRPNLMKTTLAPSTTKARPVNNCMYNFFFNLRCKIELYLLIHVISKAKPSRMASILIWTVDVNISISVLISSRFVRQGAQLHWNSMFCQVDVTILRTCPHRVGNIMQKSSLVVREWPQYMVRHL